MFSLSGGFLFIFYYLFSDGRILLSYFSYVLNNLFLFLYTYIYIYMYISEFL